MPDAFYRASISPLCSLLLYNTVMDGKDIKLCGSAWKHSAEAMRKTHDLETEKTDAGHAIILLEDAYLSAMKSFARNSSGLVEMHKFLRRLKS